MKKNNLIIAGVHKAGTTSLYTYLSWHPSICAANVKETHFFSDINYSKRFKNYEDYFSHCKAESYILEASPEYIYGKGETADKIKDYNNSAKIILIFRNPADKIYSSFKHRKKKLLFDRNYTFSEFKKEYLNVTSLDEVDSNNDFSKELLDGSYIDYLPVWFEKFGSENIKIIFFDDLKDDPRVVLRDLCKWINIDESYFFDKDFPIENKSVSFKNKSLQSLSIKIADFMEPILRRNYRIKSFLRKIYYSINVDNQEEFLDADSLREISSLYENKNIRLKSFLEKHGYKKFPEWL